MRLIDADALDLEREVEMADDWKTAHEIANVVKYAPTVPAVPVDKVCELLCKNGDMPPCRDCKKYGLECDYRKCGSPDHWKQFLTKWMEKISQLEEQQNATE